MKNVEQVLLVNPKAIYEITISRYIQGATA